MATKNTKGRKKSELLQGVAEWQSHFVLVKLSPQETPLAKRRKEVG
jgi:hypothetical protein